MHIFEFTIELNGKSRTFSGRPHVQVATKLIIDYNTNETNL